MFDNLDTKEALEFRLLFLLVVVSTPVPLCEISSGRDSETYMVTQGDYVIVLVHEYYFQIVSSVLDLLCSDSYE